MKNVIELKIDPQFQSQIPPLTEDEFKQLQDNILEDGEVYEPIIIWNNTIIDGHNRWKIIKDNWEILKDKYQVKEMTFQDKWAAFEWMYKKQLGRRNLTKEQWKYMVGKMYEVRNRGSGAPPKNENAKKQCGQNDHIVFSEEAKRTESIIAEELGIGSRSVRRAGEFARGVDALKSVSGEAGDIVLKGQAKLTQEEIQRIPQMSPTVIEEVAHAIINDDPIPRQAMRQEQKNRGWTKADREKRTKLETIATDMYARTTIPEYTVDSLVDDIQLCAEGFVQQIKNTLKDRSDVLTAENKPIISDAIDLYIIKEIEKVRNLLK